MLLFFNKLLNPHFNEQSSPRICRLKTPLGEDIVYAVLQIWPHCDHNVSTARARFRLERSIGFIPWALAGVMDDLKKTNKATLLNEVENSTEPLDSLPDAYASIFDGMTIGQKARATELTFDELPHQMFQSILLSSRGTKRIDVVFNVYMKFLKLQN